jgi:acetoin utilization deacetylase AcuC-like enzyme
MEVIVASHPSASLHDTGPRHPERPERVAAVLRGVADSGLSVSTLVSPAAERRELALVHEPTYIEMIEKFCELGGGALDMDTFVSGGSWQAALTAAGGLLAVIEEMRPRSDAVGLALSRPPGHHAMPDRAMGFCLFNNVAVAAARLRSEGERVAILDWDVHHGNGTQAMLGDDPGVLYVSIHQDHFYPFAGQVDDIETGEAKGTVVNIPVPAGTAGDVYRPAWEGLVLPVVAQFEPDWVLVSAGFDAHADDELANLCLQASDYGWMAHRLSAVHPSHRIVLTLEGGYDLDALRASARSTLLGLTGTPPERLASLESSPMSSYAVAEAATAIARHWKV